jgi:hypothetical protein
MGATKSDSSESRQTPPTSVTDLENYALSRLPAVGIAKMRMAGEKSGDIGALTSLAEESAKQKYSGDAYSKSPSGYLATSAKPAGSSVA